MNTLAFDETTMGKFKVEGKVFIVESSTFVKEVYVVKSSGGFCLIRYTKMVIAGTA